MDEGSIYDDLPADPEDAFLFLEEEFRVIRDREVAKADASEQRSDIYDLHYMSQVIAAISELGLQAEFSTEIPPIENLNYQVFLNFSNDVKHYVTRLKIRRSRRIRGFSVRFDATAKVKIRHHLLQIREIVDILEIGDEKREILYAKINALQQEVDRDRTRLEAFGDLVIEVASIGGKASEKLEPARKWIDSIARLIWGAREEEHRHQKKLPPGDAPKQIEHRGDQKAPAPPNGPGALDDDIPF